jgi:biopolymer transport protein ExbD
MSIQSNDHSESVISEINVTPLVDIMLVIFIVFLIALSSIKINSNIHLPKDISSGNTKEHFNVNVSIDSQGNLFLNNKSISPSKFVNTMQEMKVSHPDLVVHVSGDENAKFENVSQMIKACQTAGINKIKFLTQAPQKK